MKRLAFAALAALVISASTAATDAMGANYGVTQRYVLGGVGKWDYITLDSAAGRLYIARGNRVMVMDTKTGTLVGEVAGANGAHRVVILPDMHRGFVSNGHGDSITPFDLTTLKPLPEIHLSGKDADGMLYDTSTSRLWAFNGHSNDVSVVDPVAGKEVGKVALPGKPEFAVTDDAGHIYVNLEDKSKLVQIDARAGKVTAIWPLTPGESPTGLAIDVEHHRLFAACANNYLVVLDALDGHRVAALPIGDDPDAAGYDAGTGNVFSSNSDGTLTVIHQNDADHYAVVTNVATAKSARTLAVDPHSHQVFLAAPDVGAKETSAAAGTFGVLVVGAH